MKHTPGPLEVRYKGFLYTVIDKEGRIIAMVDGNYGDLETNEEHEERHLADVKIFAASSDMLEALKYYFDVLKEARGESWNKNPDHVLVKMIAAYKKATE